MLSLPKRDSIQVGLAALEASLDVLLELQGRSGRRSAGGEEEGNSGQPGNAPSSAPGPIRQNGYKSKAALECCSFFN